MSLYNFFKIIGGVILIVLFLAFLYVVFSLPSVKSWYYSQIKSLEKYSPNLAIFVEYVSHGFYEICYYAYYIVKIFIDFISSIVFGKPIGGG